ncbi:thiosulfate sulfurtransferase 16, chloroplastic-like [Wolffia australiana]
MASTDVTTVDVSTASDLVSSGHRYLDVRTAEEFNKGHPEGAINIPYVFFTPEGKRKNPEFLDKAAEIFGKDDPIVVACAAGARSILAAGDLVSAGYKNAKNMEGGFTAWSVKGLPVKKPQS